MNIFLKYINDNVEKIVEDINFPCSIFCENKKNKIPTILLLEKYNNFFLVKKIVIDKKFKSSKIKLQKIKDLHFILEDLNIIKYEFRKNKNINRTDLIINNYDYNIYNKNYLNDFYNEKKIKKWLFNIFIKHNLKDNNLKFNLKSIRIFETFIEKCNHRLWSKWLSWKKIFLINNYDINTNLVFSIFKKNREK